MPQQVLSSRPFQIARLGSRERRSLARAYLALGCSHQLLQQYAPSSFLGTQHYKPFQPEDGKQPAPKVVPITTDQQVRDSYFDRRSVEQRMVPPNCPDCHVNMKWYRSKKAEQNSTIVDHLFSCSGCGQIALVSTFMQVDVGVA